MADASAIQYRRDDDGIVVLTLDDPRESVNTMNEAYMTSMAATIDRLEDERDDIVGVVITSAKQTFFAGGDLTRLRRARREDAEALTQFVGDAKSYLRRLEILGKPVVAAINGAALGGGFEICLACHHRVIVDEPRSVVGFPEVTLGLLPGAGGVVRSVRMLGVVKALAGCLLLGQRLPPGEAQELGLVDEIVETIEELVPTAKAWILANPGTAQPWDVEGYELPGEVPSELSLATLPGLPANLRRQIAGPNYPAPHHIMAAAVEGAAVDFEAASEIEGRYFLDLLTGQVAKNMIQAYFFDLHRVNGDRGRPESTAEFRARKVVVLGAGMMGAAISYVCANAGIDVVLKDVSLDAAKRGKEYSQGLVQKSVSQGRSTHAQGDALLARITPTDNPADAAGADLMIEAVFEDPQIKASVYAETEPHLAPDALLGSNTSTLPISELADGVSRSDGFIGLHFFSPVDKMPLLEIIRGAETSDLSTYRALDFAKQIKKIPIVVNDSRGFFTSRVITTFINEGIAMLGEGIPAEAIEQATVEVGYPAPVLQLTDELNMELLDRIYRVTRDAVVAAGNRFAEHPAHPIVAQMVTAGRPGRLRGAGFYEYVDGKRSGLWSGLQEMFPVKVDPADFRLRELGERMLIVEALETVKCLDERVIESVADANIGSIMGIGFPGWTGGVLQYINGFEGGIPGFVVRCNLLAAQHGDRFTPPASLLERAERGELYTDEEASAFRDE